LFEEVSVLTARSNTFKVLCKYRLSFSPTLIESFYILDNGENREPSLLDTVEPPQQQFDSKLNDSTELADTALDDNIADEKDAKRVTNPEYDFFSKDVKSGEIESKTYASGATLLSVHNTPDFMLLPLELQGYCPWTIVNARGLLVPGKPALGVIRYDNLYFVCDHTAGDCFILMMSCSYTYLV
jgi:hypothetical protein